MRRILSALIFVLCTVFPATVYAQSSGTTPPPPPVCSSSNAGAIYTNTGTSPATVYTCSYYNLAWNWVVNPSYGGIVYYPTLPATCSGALPAFESGWPDTTMYVCVNGVPTPYAGATAVLPYPGIVYGTSAGGGTIATSAQIAAALSATPSPVSVGTLTASTSVTTPSLTVSYLNGTPQADQFLGADFCAKLRAANVWALANSYQLVDATHFPSAVTCSVDPVQGLEGAGNSAKLTILLPASWISSSVPWLVNNAEITLRGMGRSETILAYTGATVVPAVLTIGGSSTNAYYPNGVTVKDMSVIGGLGNATDGILAQDAGSLDLQNISTWGVTGCGIHTEGVITPTIYKPHTWSDEASRIGYNSSSYSIPTSGLCFDQTTPGFTTTDGTVVDPIATGTGGVGFNYIAVQGMTMIGGTSEGNLHGLALSTNAVLNTFIDTDIEANSPNVAGTDINDAGDQNHYENVIAVSPCSGCSSVSSSDYRSSFVDGNPATGVAGMNVTKNGYMLSGTYGRVFENDATANGETPITMYTPNLPVGGTSSIIGGMNLYGSNYESFSVSFLNNGGSGSTANQAEFGIAGAPFLKLDGLGNTIAPTTLAVHGLSQPANHGVVATGTASATGGSLPAGTYYAKIAYVDAYGNTTAASYESTAVTTTGSTSSISWAFNVLPGVTSVNIYVGTTPGGESYYFNSTTSPYVQTSTSGTAGAPPTSNTTGEFTSAHITASTSVTTPAILQPAAQSTGGTCTMASSTTCTVTLAHTYTTPVCIATEQDTGTVIAGECSVSGTTVTITAASSNSVTWGALVFGNPN
jgi:hypothetical protein